MPSQFITNQDELLSSVIHDILPSCDRLSFLVGYFYFSGFEALCDMLADKAMRILVGMDVERDICNKIREYEIIQEVHFSRGEIRKNYYASLVELFNDTDFFDTEQKRDAFKRFLQKIQDGTLEIRKTLKPNHAKLYLFHKMEGHDEGGRYPGAVITGSSNLSLSGLTSRHEINVVFRDEHFSEGQRLFDDLWEKAVNIIDANHYKSFEDEVIQKIWVDKLFKPFLIYLRVLDEYFKVENVSVRLPQSITQNRYLNLKYQTDAIRRALHIIKVHNGVMIADVVGLGKSIIASTIAHNMGIKTVIIAPPHLTRQWDDYRFEYDFNARVYSSGLIEKALLENQESDEKLIIIDEAHKFRNEDTSDYALLHRLCQGNKVVLLTATPFNNRPQDIFSMIKLFQIPAKSTIQTIESLSYRFRELIREYKAIDSAKKSNELSKPEEKARIQELAKKIRALTAPVLIRRSRLDLAGIEAYRSDLETQGIALNHIEPPVLLEYELGDLSRLYIETLDRISPEETGAAGFIGARYKPTSYLKDPDKFRDQLDRDFGDENLFLQSQINIAKFMQRLLVRRFESSIASFRISLDHLIFSAQTIETWAQKLGKIPIYKKGRLPDVDALLEMSAEDAQEEAGGFSFEEELQAYTEKGLVLIDISELKKDFLDDVKADIDLLKDIREKWFGSGQAHDPKLVSLKSFLRQSFQRHPGRKIVIFTEFADTADYLGRELSADFRVFKYSAGDSTVRNKQIIRNNFDAGLPSGEQEDAFDVLVATDAISEGFNLHRAGVIFNYDIPYNPTRVIQRVGRINRINKKVFDQLEIFNFFPTATGEKIIRTGQIANLKIHMIHALLGEDTKILTDEEELISYFREEWENAWNAYDQRSWDVDSLNILNHFKIHEPGLIEQARAIPKRSRVRRTAEKARSGVIVFGKKGDEYTFKLGEDTLNYIDLTAEDAIAFFQAEAGEKPEPVSDQFEPVYQYVKSNLFNRKSQVPVDRGKQKTLDVIRWLLGALPNHKDYLNDLLQVVLNLDSLPHFFLKKIRSIRETDPFQALCEIQSVMPHAYLTQILEKARKIDEGDETVILSEELI